MKFGMNVLLWTDQVDDRLLPILEKCKKMGYDGVELPIFDPDPEKYKAWGKRLDDIGLGRTVVTIRTAADNPISPDPKVRAAGVQMNKRTLDSCQALGCKTLLGPFHSALAVFSGKGPTTDEWNWAVEGMKQTAEHAEKVDVNLAVEYLNRFEIYLLNCAADAVRFVKEVNHPRCGLMFDTFHTHIEEKNIRQAVRLLSEHLIHVHISENDRSTPGKGLFRWDELFDALHEVGYDGWMVVEAFGSALPSIAAATKIWRRMFEDEDELAREALAFMQQNVRKRWK